MGAPDVSAQTSREAQLEELLAARQIEAALARYCRGIDRRDGDLLRSIYHPDARDEHGWGTACSGYEFADAVSDAEALGFPCEITQHHITSIFIDVRGEDAISEAYFLSVQRFRAEGSLWDLSCGGRYADRWERRDGEFKIIRRTVIYDLVRTDRVATMWPGPDFEVPKNVWGSPELPSENVVWGMPGSADPSYELLDVQSPPRASSAS